MRCRYQKTTSVSPVTALQQFIFLIVLSLSFLPIDCVRADTVVRVVETWPPEITSPWARTSISIFGWRMRPTSLSISGLVHISTASPPMPAATLRPVIPELVRRLAGFSLIPRGEVDEVRIEAGDGSASNTSVVAVWRSDIVGGNEVGKKQPEPAWIAEMTVRAKAVQDEAYRARMRQPPRSSDTFLVVVFVCVALAFGFFGFIMPAWAVWRWHGAWRWRRPFRLR